MLMTEMNAEAFEFAPHAALPAMAVPAVGKSVDDVPPTTISIVTSVNRYCVADVREPLESIRSRAGSAQIG